MKKSIKSLKPLGWMLLVDGKPIVADKEGFWFGASYSGVAVWGDRKDAQKIGLAFKRNMHLVPRVRHAQTLAVFLVET